MAKKKCNVIPYNSPRTVNIKKAKNGYVINTYGNDKDVTFIAKTKKEAQKIVNKEIK